MNASNFDQFTRAFGRPASRRGLLALAGGFMALRRHQGDAAQLSPDSCASTGEVCTLLYGCCSGLSCATSAINPSYGVCVPGDGGTVSTGTALVVPSNGGDAAAAPVTTDTSTSTTTTDPQAEREQKIAEKKSRRDAHRNRVELRKDEQKDNKEDQQERRELARGPELEFRLTLPTADDDREFLKVFNRDNLDVVINRIESLTSADFSEGTPIVNLDTGESFVFISGSSSGLTGSRLDWTTSRLCQSASGGFNVTASFNTNAENFEYEILCDGPSIVLFDHPNKKKKGNKGNNGDKGNNRNRQRSKGRGNKKHKSG